MNEANRESPPNDVPCRALPMRAAGWVLACVPLGWILGTVLQLQQSALSPSGVYVGAALLGVVACAGGWQLRRSPVRLGLICLMAALALAWAAAGMRAWQHQQQALAPALEGVDLVLTGVVDAMPQVSDGVQRFQFAVESASEQGRAVEVPALVRLGWYPERERWRVGDGEVQARGDPPPKLVAGDRWRFTARLIAPHGNANPHAFDYELWLWERGIAATGTVRAGPRDPPPELLARGVGRWVERVRQLVRARIARAIPPRLTASGAGGVVVALATGDQRAIPLDADNKVEN